MLVLTGKYVFETFEVFEFKAWGYEVWGSIRVFWIFQLQMKQKISTHFIWCFFSKNGKQNLMKFFISPWTTNFYEIKQNVKEKLLINKKVLYNKKPVLNQI